MSNIESEFLRVLSDGHKATADRIIRRLHQNPDLAAVEMIVREEIRGLFHGTLVVLDNGSSLANQSMIKIVDDYGDQFASDLHERIGEVYEDQAEPQR